MKINKNNKVALLVLALAVVCIIGGAIQHHNRNIQREIEYKNETIGNEQHPEYAYDLNYSYDSSYKILDNSYMVINYLNSVSDKTIELYSDKNISKEQKLKVISNYIDGLNECTKFSKSTYDSIINTDRYKYTIDNIINSLNILDKNISLVMNVLEGYKNDLINDSEMININDLEEVDKLDDNTKSELISLHEIK